MIAGALELALVVACLGFLAVSLVAERRRAKRILLVAKTSASLSFVALALVVGAHRQGAYGRAVLAGLLLATIGDVALAFRGSRRAFLLGLIAFLFGHIAYAGAFFSLIRVDDLLHPLSIVPLVTSAAVFVWLRPHLGKMLVPVACYFVAITTMVIFALAVPGATGLLLGGALGFYASDVAVARERFVKSSFSNRLWGLPTYYVAQLLLALSTRA